MTDGDCPSIETLHRSAADDRLDAGIRGHLDRCPRCRAALEEIRRDDDLLADLVRANADVLLGSDTRRGVPEIEGYDLLGEIHRGGQGVVYRAIHNATKRPVAIKTLLQGTFATARQRQRFEREVELAADLRHPHIVTLYDSGRTADGGHFLAMELVEGRPLDQALRHDGLAPPGDERGVRRVLRLVAKIGRAVEAAHLRGVIHRDLKPANILVDESGEPRVLDFGLAKRAETPAAAGATMTGEFLGTCAYAAPEQLAGDPAAVDIRADVYALGVILYESLTGDRPLEATGSMAEVIEAIRHEPPRRPSSRNRAVDDEVETIVLTALAKEPARRYQSAGALVDDIERSLAGAPIAAKRDSRGYLLRKTIQRHRVAVSVAALVVLLTVVFAVAMGVLARQAVTARQRADDATARATGTLTSFLSILGSDQLQRRVGPETIPSLLAKADRIVSEQLRDQPAVAAAVRRELGLVLLARGDFDAALDQFEEALALRRRVRPDDHEAIAESLHNCGRALWYLDRPREAEGRYREALRLRRELLGAEDETVALTTSHLAACLRRQGRYEEAEQGYRAVLALRRRLHGPNA
ncbi:MAG: serine/threonine-protein kinase, partial [Planctomycetota bacterium]